MDERHGDSYFHIYTYMFDNMKLNPFMSQLAVHKLYDDAIDAEPEVASGRLGGMCGQPLGGAYDDASSSDEELDRQRVRLPTHPIQHFGYAASWNV